MLNDVWNSIRSYIEERLGSPLLTGFLVAWSIINYRFFLIVVADESFPKKIELINQYVFPLDGDRVWKGLIFPILAALFYVSLYPFIDRYVYRVWRWHQNSLVRIRQSIDGERPLTETDRVELLRRLHDAEQARIEAQKKEQLLIEAGQVT